jgi:DNA-binding response OmpR family regulator
MARKILVVDDEVTVRDLLKDTFVIEGYDVRLAE